MSIADDKAKRDADLAAWQASMPTTYQNQQWQGDFTPEQLGQVAQQDPTALANITLDPTQRAAQMAALSKYQQLGQSGYDDTDRAAIAQTMTQSAQQEQSQRGAILQNAQARGMGGSGAELASQLANQQGAANRNSMAGTQIASAGRQRALEALGQGSTLAGNMQQADFARQAQIAQAKDAVSRFNTQNQVDQQQYNNNLVNQARSRNMAGRQQIANSNVTGQNQFAQQQFGNQGQVSQTQYNASTNDINAQMAADAERKRKQAAMAGALGSLAGGIIGAGSGGGAAGATAGAGIGNTVGNAWG